MRGLATTILLSLFLALPACGDGLPTDDDGGGDAFPEVADRVAETMGDEVESFTIVELPMDEVAAGLEGGSVELPLVDSDGRAVDVTLDSEAVQLRAPGLEQGVERSGLTSDPQVEEVPLPPEQNFMLGTCVGADEVTAGSLECGAATLLDDARTMLGAQVHHPDVGTAYLQPVDLVLDETPTSGLHVLYNADDAPAVVFAEDEQPETPASSTAAGASPSRDVARSHSGTQRETQIVLDGDREFYEQDPGTVFRRQEMKVLMARLTYALIEPNSSHTWRLDLEIKGQEVWVSGGPTTTDKVELNRTLGDPSYFLVHPVDDDEIHFFFVGYRVTGVLGRAGGIPGGNADAFGGGTEDNNAYAQSFPRYSLKKEAVVIAHEIGHLMGAVHGDGCTSCSSGTMSGFSLMPRGGAGAATSRDFFFSDANDENVAAALGSILP